MPCHVGSTNPLTTSYMYQPNRQTISVSYEATLYNMYTDSSSAQVFRDFELTSLLKMYGNENDIDIHFKDEQGVLLCGVNFVTFRICGHEGS